MLFHTYVSYFWISKRLGWKSLVGKMNVVFTNLRLMLSFKWQDIQVYGRIKYCSSSCSAKLVTVFIMDTYIPVISEEEDGNYNLCWHPHKIWCFFFCFRMGGNPIPNSRLPYLTINNIECLPRVASGAFKFSLFLPLDFKDFRNCNGAWKSSCNVLKVYAVTQFSFI